MKNILTLILIMVSFFKVEFVYTGEPIRPIYGTPVAVRYDTERREWIDKTPGWDMVSVLADLKAGAKKHSLPIRIPEKKEIKIKEKKINREEKKTEKPAEEKKEIEVNKEEKK